MRWFAARGCRVTGIDRDATALEPLRGLAEIVVADIENAAGRWPGRRFDAVVVTNYLWRPLLPTLVASVAAGGVLIYETFAHGNETFGKPSNPDFLLRPGELLDAVRRPAGGGLRRRLARRAAALRAAHRRRARTLPAIPPALRARVIR